MCFASIHACRASHCCRRGSRSWAIFVSWYASRPRNLASPRGLSKSPSARIGGGMCPLLTWRGFVTLPPRLFIVPPQLLVPLARPAHVAPAVAVDPQPPGLPVPAQAPAHGTATGPEVRPRHPRHARCHGNVQLLGCYHVTNPP